MDHYLNLAKKTLENYLKKGKVITPPQDLPSEFNQKRAGCFVSLHTKDGDLRGCIGTYLPTKKNIAEEIINNAIAAACHDPRFLPVTSQELAKLEYSVDILTEPVLINKLTELDPKKFGVLVKTNDGRAGLLLPDLEGVETIDEQLTIACQKANIRWPVEQPQIYKFTVERHK